MTKRLIVLLGARMRETRAPFGWHFPLFLAEEGHERGGIPGEVSGGGSRMRAIKALYERTTECIKPQLHILVTGGNERNGDSRADEAARQLVGRYGLPQEAVVSIRGEGSTVGNAAATADYVAGNPNFIWQDATMEIVTNDYHMLRAWIIFSMQMGNGKFCLTLSTHDQSCIEGILLGGLPTNEGWSASRIREDRNAVIAILRPYFHGKWNIVTRVVEDVLENESHKIRSTRRYAQRLRNNMWVKQTLCLEYERVMHHLGA
jgi:hypothetical protein